MLTLIPLSLHYFESLTIPRLLRLQTCATLHPCTEQTSSSIAAMTSRSVGTSSINISPVEERSETRTSDLTDVHIFLWCKFKVVFYENERSQ